MKRMANKRIITICETANERGGYREIRTGSTKINTSVLGIESLVDEGEFLACSKDEQRRHLKEDAFVISLYIEAHPKREVAVECSEMVASYYKSIGVSELLALSNQRYSFAHSGLGGLSLKGALKNYDNLHNDCKDTKMNTIYIRVLEHDTADQIRIGYAFPTNNIVKTAQDIFTQEDKSLNWCGGALLSAPKFYKRIALVDARTLQTVKDIYDGKEWDPCVTQ